MESQTKKQVEQALKGKYFNLCVDLGPGYGEAAPILKKHCTHLIGVDHDTTRALRSGYNTLYDQLIQMDARNYPFPPNCDLVTMFDFIEHLPPQDAQALLNRISNRFTIITTPSKYFPGALNGHASLWTEQTLQQHGFKTKTYSAGPIRNYLYGKKIIAVRERR